MKIVKMRKMVKMRKTKYNCHTSDHYYNDQMGVRIFRNPRSVSYHPVPRDLLWSLT